MHSIERIIGALTGTPVDRPPFICPGGMMNMMTVQAMEALSAAWPQCHCDAQEMARIAQGIQKLTGIENIGVPYCMTVEAEILGAGISMGTRDSEPRVDTYPIAELKQFEKLTPKELGSKRFEAVVGAIDLLSKRRTTYPVFANLTGPVSLATSLIEPMTFYKALGKTPELSHEFMQFVTEHLISLGKLMLKAGAQILTISDPSASGEIMGPRRFSEFALPYLNCILDALKNHYAASLVHICGNLKRIFPELLHLHTFAISIDSATSIKAMRNVIKDEKVIVGNVSTHLLMNGTPERVERASLSCLKRGVAILAPACGISPYTPLANMRAMAAAVSRNSLKNVSTPKSMAPGKIHQLEASSDGEILIHVMARNSLLPANDCGGLGICGKCKVKMIEGKVCAHHSEELAHLSQKELDSGFRLACLCRVQGTICVSLPEQSDAMRIQAQGKALSCSLNPAIRKTRISLSAEGNGSFYGAFLNRAVIRNSNILNVLKELTGMPSSTTMVTFNDQCVGIEAGQTDRMLYGVAVDIGTTTLVAELVDLTTGQTIATASTVNPQFSLGADVLSRIHFAQKKTNNIIILSKLVRDGLNELIAELCATAKVAPIHCYVVSVAGNTVMMHLFLGIDPSALGRYPYRPVFLEALQLSATELNLQVSPFAVVQCLPGLTGFIGADISAGLVALNLLRSVENTLFLDMGTNGEIVLCFNGRMMTTSTAAGPALEGMNISCGIKAVSGAIERVAGTNGQITWSTIGDGPARGLCGSGLLDLVATLLKAGIIQKTGRFIPPEGESHILESDGKRCFQLLAPSSNQDNGIYLSQQDVRQVQLAKGALAAGIKLLLEQAQVKVSDIQTVYIAGGFGYYLNPETLVTIGLLPSQWQDRIVYVGNTSLAGARLAMLDNSLFEKNQHVLKAVEYCDLNTIDTFDRVFSRAMSFGRTVFEQNIAADSTL